MVKQLLLSKSHGDLQCIDQINQSDRLQAMGQTLEQDLEHYLEIIMYFNTGIAILYCGSSRLTRCLLRRLSGSQ